MKNVGYEKMEFRECEMTVVNIGSTYKIRLVSYKSIRHYGDCDFTPYVHIVDATLVAIQDGYQPYIVTLNDRVKDHTGHTQYKKGHKIAIREKDFNLTKEK